VEADQKVRPRSTCRPVPQGLQQGREDIFIILRHDGQGANQVLEGLSRLRQAAPVN
jgi:hypothetical protein